AMGNPTALGAANLAIANAFFQTWSNKPGTTLPDGTALPGTDLLADVFNGWAQGFANPNGVNFTSYTPNPTGSGTGDFPAATPSAQQSAPPREPGSIVLVPTPAPGSMALLPIGIGGLLGRLCWKRRRKVAA